MCSQQPVTGPYPGPRILFFTFLRETLYGFCLYQCKVPPRWQPSVVSCTNTKWDSLFLLQNSKTGHVQIVQQLTTLMAVEKSRTVVFNTDICLYLKVAQCQDDHKQ